jgi:hypothetical protein
MRIGKPSPTPAGYLTMKEAAESIGIDRPSALNRYLKRLDITPYRPKHTQHPYLTESDVVRIREYRRRTECPHMREQEQIVMWAIRTLRLQRADITAEAIQSLLASNAIEYTQKVVQAAMDNFTRCGYQIAEYPPDLPLLSIPLQSKTKAKAKE